MRGVVNRVPPLSRGNVRDVPSDRSRLAYAGYRTQRLRICHQRCESDSQTASVRQCAEGSVATINVDNAGAQHWRRIFWRESLRRVNRGGVQLLLRQLCQLEGNKGRDSRRVGRISKTSYRGFASL